MEERECDWPSLAQALKKLTNDLKFCRIVHGDLQAHNIILGLDRHGRVKDAKAVDFEDTYLVKESPTDNLYILLSDMFGEQAIIPQELVKEMMKVYSLPRDMLNWTDLDFDSLAHKIPRIRNFIGLPTLQVLEIR